MLVGLKRISVAVGLLAATGLGSSPARAQGVAASPNQALADAVAATLRSSPALAAYRVEIEARAGLVTLSGAVADPAQRAEAIARARAVAGVARVVDRIRVGGDIRVRPADYEQIAYGGSPNGYGAYLGPGVTGAPVAPPAGAMTLPPGFGGPIAEGPAGMVGATQAAAPGLSNYAWPSFAGGAGGASAVNYPTTYPWQAWTTINPAYPNPEIPFDWRAVTLRWDDGIWWLDFKTHYWRPFFTPYPFSIWAY